MDALDEAINSPDQRFSDSQFEGILRALAGDSGYDEETGDCSEFGLWACLFKFDEEERARIDAALDIHTPVWDASGYVTFMINDAGFCGWEDGREAFDKINKAYGAFLDECEENH